MSNNTNIPSYNFTHISSYVNGTMSREDMYAFEKAMLADPFLEDAVEGFREANIKKAETDLAAIKNLLLPEKDEAKIVPFYQKYKTWLNAAATIIVVASVGAITYAVFNNSSKNKEVAIVTPSKEKTIVNADTTAQITNQATATDKEASTVTAYKNQPVIVTDKQVTLSLTRQETVSSLTDDKLKVDTSTNYVGSSVPKLTEKELNSLQPVSIDQALQGRIAGVEVDKRGKKSIGPMTSNVANNGYTIAKNANNPITIRGNNSINKNQQPLYVVDGIILDSLPTYLNANTINNMQILKDTAATSIYGAKGANGVVVVTTNNQAEALLAKQNAASKAKEIDNLSKSIAANNTSKLLKGVAISPVKDSITVSKSSLDEVVVIGYGSAKKREVTGSAAKHTIDPLDSLMPVGGWQFYSKYINQKIGFIGDTTSNNQLVLTDKDGHKLDDIDIEFSVDKEGTAYNVKVITDIDSAKAKTLANAVTEGPKWISRKKKNKVKIPLKTP